MLGQWMTSFESLFKNLVKKSKSERWTFKINIYIFEQIMIQNQ